MWVLHQTEFQLYPRPFLMLQQPILSNKLSYIEYPTFYSVDIEADKIYQTKKKKDMLCLENQEQSFTDAFEYRCS